MPILPEPPLPPGLNLEETKVPSLVSGFVVTWVLGLICVALRLSARRLINNNLWWDDWLISVSPVFSAGFMLDVLCYMTMRGGFGKHIWAAPKDGIRVYFIGLFIAQHFYTVTMSLIKCSILAFYWRLFNPRRSTRRQIWILFSVVCVWGVTSFLLTNFQCIPIAAFWRRFDPNDNITKDSYVCPIRIHHFFIATSIPNITTDIFMLLIPLPCIWSLQLCRPQKIALLGIFALGLFITAISFIRLSHTLSLNFKSMDVTWDFTEGMLWTGIEVNAGIVCACLPSLAPMVNFFIYKTVSGSSLHHTSGAQSGTTTVGGLGEFRGVSRFDLSTGESDTRPDTEHEFELVQIDDESHNGTGSRRRPLSQVIVTKEFEFQVDYYK
ncbi:hypothetical protein VFPPC_15487 [Pochonia chlamydosporia 170]|uniref:Rhodopsin domain-containing protein n=1 Tax=Pochonia chlamydosporia 170 TaxID=1380566 RepID=A0A179FVW6_METCM|nr:hypothetical protein VFPPC_15487 [Pochonia chlamydosporia 170]OAQ69796.1 hypothetical protein VFPPC_15487 [Pochonia chlamydosporia 170]